MSIMKIGIDKNNLISYNIFLTIILTLDNYCDNIFNCIEMYLAIINTLKSIRLEH